MEVLSSGGPAVMACRRASGRRGARGSQQRRFGGGGDLSSTRGGGQDDAPRRRSDQWAGTHGGDSGASVSAGEEEGRHLHLALARSQPVAAQPQLLNPVPIRVPIHGRAQYRCIPAPALHSPPGLGPLPPSEILNWIDYEVRPQAGAWRLAGWGRSAEGRRRGAAGGCGAALPPTGCRWAGAGRVRHCGGAAVCAGGRRPAGGVRQGAAVRGGGCRRAGAGRGRRQAAMAPGRRAGSALAWRLGERAAPRPLPCDLAQP
ncbi:hypothetical protein PVAP13_3KG127268 [Panicum virgatum]|uniref:Uncharacterized protein n=1 Tax=Panicum virgatum TaxID=38727 RepID=A0A8T0UZR7_PANVG|nr:hypothetical protein PVAP13_3KG127268 [Panicum virgatum]